MTYDEYKDIPRRTASDKVLCDKSFTIASNPQYYGYQQEFISMVYKCFDKKSRDTTTHTGTVIISEYQQLDNKLQKPIKKRKIHSSFRDNFWGADLVDMDLIRKYNKGIRFLMCVLFIFTANTHGLPF